MQRYSTCVSKFIVRELVLYNPHLTSAYDGEGTIRDDNFFISII